MNKTVRLILSVLLTLSFLPVGAFAQSPATVTDAFLAIRKEGIERSEIMKTLHVFTDLYGPRLTGSPNVTKAGKWAVKRMKGWGFDKAEMEPWDFGREGWTNERASVFIVSPVQDSLAFEVVAWTPSTKGVASGEAARIVPPSNPTQAELDGFFSQAAPLVKNKVVLIGMPASIPVNFDPPQKRLSDEVAKRQFDPINPAPTPTPVPTPGPAPGRLTAANVAQQLDKFLVASGALVRINDAAKAHGQIVIGRSSSYDIRNSVPTVVLRNEDFGRISRLLDGGHKVSLEFDIHNRTHPEGKTAYNVVGEITGTDKKDEIVMLGAHFDSWHAGTGTTDNGSGSAIVMEVGRILKAIGFKPRRTIRLGLWSGEELGLLGSAAYVKRHFGTLQSPTSEYAKLSVYFNCDSGTGRVRGFTVFGPPDAAIPLREVTSQFSDYGAVGVNRFADRLRGSSDFFSFNRIGLPGVRVVLDPIEYNLTWHSNFDTYERVVEDDAKRTAIVIAAAVYYVAMQDEMMPRYKASELGPEPLPTPSRN